MILIIIIIVIIIIIIKRALRCDIDIRIKQG